MLGGIWTKLTAVGALILSGLAFYFKSRADANEAKAKRQRQRADSLQKKASISKAANHARSKAREEARKHEREKQQRRRHGDRPDGNFGDRL